MEKFAASVVFSLISLHEMEGRTAFFMMPETLERSQGKKSSELLHNLFRFAAIYFAKFRGTKNEIVFRKSPWKARLLRSFLGQIYLARFAIKNGESFVEFPRKYVDTFWIFHQEF